MLTTNSTGKILVMMNEMLNREYNHVQSADTL